jgi:predicted cation transporter
MIVGLLIILALVLVLPFVVKIVEHNLEIFLFIMGLASVIIAGAFNWSLFLEILENSFLYFITGAVLVFGLLFIFLKDKVSALIGRILRHIPFRAFVLIMIIVLGLLSSVITAIIAALLLVEILNVMPIKRQQKVGLNVIACFSIGLGAVLTPVGEPLATVVLSKLNVDFFYLLRLLGIYVIPGIAALGVFGLLYVHKNNCQEQIDTIDRSGYGPAKGVDLELTEEFTAPDTVKGAVIRAVKIFFFVFALELLGTGFKPLIDAYVINLPNVALYWLNMISAVLDNATLAAAEISTKMTAEQISAVLMGLLISGGMLIPGNIPNIISAGKLKITSREWARVGAPIGLMIMVVFFVILFVIV